MASLSLFPAFATMLNASLGAGFLIVPLIFLQVGAPIAIIGIVSISLLSLIVSLMLIESASRAEALKQMEDSGLIIPQSFNLLNIQEAKFSRSPSVKPRRSSDPLQAFYYK